MHGQKGERRKRVPSVEPTKERMCENENTEDARGDQRRQKKGRARPGDATNKRETIVEGRRRCGGRWSGATSLRVKGRRGDH